MDTASYRVVASLKAGGVVLDKPEWIQQAIVLWPRKAGGMVLDKPEWIQQAIGLWPRSRLVGLY